MMLAMVIACSVSQSDSAMEVDPCDGTLREEFILQQSECVDGVCLVSEGEFIMGEWQR